MPALALVDFSLLRRRENDGRAEKKNNWGTGRFPEMPGEWQIGGRVRPPNDGMTAFSGNDEKGGAASKIMPTGGAGARVRWLHSRG
jgi:hypothetical protein